ncbi:MAG TPA: translocation/assembly module TamB domain-containing protein, partial [Polyangiaceae bacterium]|nr:translocation/assembly module TamB domain-containing protein [Polyangiaceae bacterium]
SAPTLSWSSEPALPGGEADILALVIGGGSGFKGGGSIAIVANELSTIEGLEFYSTQQTGAGNSRVASLNDDSWDSYTASYQINDKLWFEGSYERQTSSATSEVHGGVSGTLDWRFLPQWALRTEVGTLGMGLDLLWQYRY